MSYAAVRLASNRASIYPAAASLLAAGLLAGTGPFAILAAWAILLARYAADFYSGSAHETANALAIAGANNSPSAGSNSGSPQCAA